MLVQNPNFISIVEGVDFRHVGEQKVIGLDSFFIKTGQGYPFGRYGIEEVNILKGLNVLFYHTGYTSVDVEWLKEVRHSLRSFGFIIFGPDNNVVAYAQCSSNRLWRFRMCRTPEYHRCYTYTFPYKGAWLLENNSNDCLSAIMNGLLER